jgi:hypothetical protein
MDGELITAIAAGVSGVAAVIAFWQACVAKSAARSAEAQVTLLLRQIEGEEVARHEARGPDFTIEDPPRPLRRPLRRRGYGPGHERGQVQSAL